MIQRLHIICFLLLVQVLPAQQLPLYSNYFYKAMVYNPSYTGDKEATEIFALNRTQFSDFQGAPVFNALVIDGKLQDKKAYLGLLVTNQRKGITTNNNALISYAYRLNFNEQMFLKFGLALGVMDQSINYAKILVANYSDPSLFALQQRKTVIDGNAGLSFYFKNLDVGIAIPQLLAGKINYSDESNVRSYYMMSRHIAASVKYEFAINKNNEIKLIPNLIIRKVKNAPMQYDAGLSASWKDKIRIGLTYRSNYALGLNAGITLNKMFSLGYSYDYLIGNLAQYAGTTNEIMFAVKLQGLKRKHINDSLSVKDLQIAELQEEVDELKNQLEKKSAPETKVSEIKHHVIPSQFSGKNVVKEKDVYILTNKATDFTNNKGVAAQKGIYIVVESCYYPDYAVSKVKKYTGFGFPNAEIIVDKISRFNYVCIDKAASKDEAFQKINEIKQMGVADVWIQILTE